VIRGEGDEPPAGTLPMPDLRGQPVYGAVSALAGLGMLVDTIPARSSKAQGTVVAQTPKPNGATPPASEPATLVISIGPGKRGTAVVAKLTGLKSRDAIRNCAVATVACKLPFVESGDEGTVVEHTPPEGQKVPRFSPVTLSVAR